MFGFKHQRNRSLIPVRDLEKTEKAFVTEISEQDVALQEEDEQPQTLREKRNMAMIFLLFLAEAIMAASLSSQIAVLVPSSSDCLSMDTSFLRSILECAYYFGSATGLFWGWTTDRFGRRKIALMGLAGMSICCVGTGFASSFVAFAILRFAAGAIAAAVTVSGLAMLADSTHGTSRRIQTVACLPMVAVCGSIGPFVASNLHALDEASGLDFLVEFSGFSGQITCASLVALITMAEMVLLEETLPQTNSKAISQPAESDIDCEKAAFLGERLSHDPQDDLNITIIEALAEDATAPTPSRISISHMLTAPSVFLLLASYSVLSLHAATFDTLLPHLGHTMTKNGGTGIPCSWLGFITLMVKALAAFRILRFLPFIIAKIGLLPMYRRISLVFPVLYILIPLSGLILNISSASATLSAFVSTLAMLAKATLSGGAQVLVLLLVFSTAPDASSTGTVIGVISISGLLKAIAVGISGMAYFFSDDYSVFVVNGMLWAALFLIALLGAGITWRLRETPRVGADIPAECLVWQDMFDTESDDGNGF